MGNLLNKKQALLLNEAAVSWENSALGVLTSAVTRPISWLKGSLKQGVYAMQIDILVKKWGLEYVNAVKIVEEEEEHPIESSEETNEEETKYTLDEINDLIVKITSELRRLRQITTAVKPLSIITEKEWRDNSANSANDFNSIRIQLSNLTQDKNIDCTELVQYLSNTPTDNTDNYGKLIDSINNFLKILLHSTTTKSEFINFKKLTTPTTIIADTIKYCKEIYNNFLDLEDIYDIIYQELKVEYKKLNTTTNDSLFYDIEHAYHINEASQYELPSNVTSLVSADEMERLKKIDNIKELTMQKINLVRLNTILYEANYIINKAKGAKGNDNNAKLQRKWDIGIQNINDFFQDVIDINTVMNKVKGTVDADTKKIVELDQEKISSLQKMSITETFPVGQKFNVNKLYAFDTLIYGQNGKKKTSILLMSPTGDFMDDEAGKKYFWFRLFGAYEFDNQKNRTKRVNIFRFLTNQKEIIFNFNNAQNAYYIALQNLQPKNATNDCFIYSNTGKYFFNDQVKNVEDIKEDLKKLSAGNFAKSIGNVAKIANIFKIRINQRFIIEDTNVNSKKYPGIELADLKSDKGFENAELNHHQMIKILSEPK